MTNDIEMMALIDTGFVAAWLSIGTIVFGLFVYVFGGKKDYIELDEPGNYVLAFFSDYHMATCFVVFRHVQVDSNSFQIL